MKRTHIALITIVALISGVILTRPTFGLPADRSDEVRYDVMGRNIGRHGMTALSAYAVGGTVVAPGYSIFIAGIYRLFGEDPDMVRGFQIVLFGALAAVAALLGERWFGARVGLVTGFSVALFWGIGAYAGLILADLLFSFVVALSLLSLSSASHGSRWRYLVAGALIGLGALTKEVFLFFVPFGIVFASVEASRRAGRRAGFAAAAAVIAGALIVVGPWQVLKIVSPAERTADVGFSIPTEEHLMQHKSRIAAVLAKRPWCHFGGHLLGYYSVLPFCPGIEPNAFRGVFSAPPPQDSYGLGWYAEHPGPFALMAVLNVITFNSPTIIRGPLWEPSVAVHPLFAVDDAVDVVLPKLAVVLGLRFAWFVLLLLVAYGMWHSRTRMRELLWPLFTIFFFNAFYGLIHGLPRYALPIYPFYFMFAITGFLAVADGVARRLRAFRRNLAASSGA